MNTPASYSQNIKKGIITKDMLLNALISISEREKNCRNNIQFYSKNPQINRSYSVDLVEREKTQLQKHLKRKQQLLSLLTPTEIHFQEQLKNTRIFSNENDYILYDNHFISGTCYYDRYGYISYKDISIPAEPQYYLCYLLSSHYFHLPISAEEIYNYKLPIKQYTVPNQIQCITSELISVQFIDKMIYLIESYNYYTYGI